ncbi:helix-turn-helix domain-containing protein [Streptomyces sp. NA02950]|uniref:PucR family transcriptional regulator n=1 Tax=Streptomyces sp. NA02950 TaxID=2742137 RepID=UPI0015925ED2|nr:helix-turn-helix domain-containing protein [Streptomyces sp. NA02950]QKV97068.1 helix-turn-helix domain-containing protein [Streptomyces sp. NA02950]
MVEDRLQFIVEQLAERLERSVVIDDSALRLLAVSAQLGRVDQSRIDAVLQRRTSHRIRAFITAQGVQRARGPVRIPRNDELGTLPRLVIPLLDQGLHLGSLWLIDDPVLTPDQVGVALAHAEEASRLLSDRVAQDSQEMEGVRRLVDNLLRPDPRVHERAAESIRELDVIEDAPSYVVAVVRARRTHPVRAGGPSALTDLRRLAGEVRRRAPRRAVLCGTPRDVELVLIASGTQRESVLGALRRSAREHIVGTRSGVDCLERVREAREDARYAADVCGVAAGSAGMSDWCELGAYSAFQHLDRSLSGLERLCPGISALWDSGNEMYECTVRSYLGHGGNVQKTAADLHIHRTTLYWRLTNVERALGVDLSSGDDRLRLHMALLFAELVPQVARIKPATPHPVAAASTTV